MKKFKKISIMLSLVLCVSMLMGMNTVFASNGRVVNSSGHFEFVQTRRIDSDGSFTFDFSENLSSGYFQLSSTQTLIRAKATCEDSNYTYYIHLYDISDNSVSKRIPFKADGKWHSHTYTGLTAGTSYSMYFSNGAFYGTGKTVTGEGTISNYVG